MNAIPADALAVLTRREVATLLRTSPRTVARITDRGDLPGFKVGSRVMYDAADVRAYIDRQKGGAA